MERNVPKLRFKGFNDEWKEKKLGEITTLTDGVHFTPDYVESGVPFWSVETIVSGVKPKYITKKAHELAIKRCQPRKNDILITRIGTLAKSKVVEDNSDFSIYVSVALVKSAKEFNSYYLKQYFDTKYYYKEFLSKSLLTATPKKINMEDLKATKVKLPLLQEQERIANFLTKVDKIIEKQDEKVKNLEKYKKGMMQKIFSQEIRFKDENGEEYPEWEEKKIKDTMEYITDFVAAGSFADIRKNVSYKEDVDYAQLIRTIDLKNKFKNKDFVYIDEKAYKYLYKVNLNKECIILPNIGANIGEVYYVHPAMFKLKNNVLGPNAILLRSDITSNKFMYYIFNNEIFRKQLIAIVGASGQPKFNKTELKEMKFKMPCSQEQIKIVNILSKIESIIEKENDKLEELKNLKRGLLQQMFV